MTVRRLILLFTFIPVLILVSFVKTASAQEIVLYASQAPVKVGNWNVVADSTAAGGARLSNTELGAAKIITAGANPADYVELTFNASAGTAYRLWMRGKVLNNSPYGDSVFVQFSGSVNSTGSPVYRIGTTSATEYNLEECSGGLLSNWGWQDNGWGIGVLGPQIFFQSTGTQTIRIQVREDGLSLDQIVLSPSAYLFSAPGSLKNDNTILAPFAGPTPTPTPAPPQGTTESANNTRVPTASQIVDSNLAVWTLVNSMILRNGGGTAGTGSQILYCNRIVYALGSDSGWYRWSNGWTHIGFIDPCGGASTPTPPTLTESANNTRVPTASQIVDSNLAVWTLVNSAILRNGSGTSGTGSQILYCNRIVYALGSDSGWYRWSNGWSHTGFVDPCGGTTPTPTPTTLTESANDTRVPTAPQIVDSNLAVWTLSNGAVLRNGGGTSGTGSQILYCNRLVYVFGGDSQWYRWNSSWVAMGTVDPCGPAPTPTPTPTPVPTPPPPPPPSGGSLRVLSWNVAFGTGTDGVRDFNRTATYIANMNPDIAGLCEMPSELISTFISSLNQMTGRSWFWYHVPKYEGTTEGNLIISKTSFSSTSGRYLSFQRSVAQVTTVIGGRTINFFATHLDAGSSSYRYTQAGELLSFTAGFSESKIVVGDFNAGPDTSESVRMTSAYYDGWMRAMNAGAAVAYPDNPIGMHTRTRRGRIDYVFYSYSAGSIVLQGTQIPDTRNLSQTNVSVVLGTLDDKGVRPSDHNPMIANFTIQ